MTPKTETEIERPIDEVALLINALLEALVGLNSEIRRAYAGGFKPDRITEARVIAANVAIADIVRYRKGDML